MIQEESLRQPKNCLAAIFSERAAGIPPYLATQHRTAIYCKESSTVE